MRLPIIEIVNRLIGETEPVGDTWADEQRYANLKELIGLTDKLIFQINEVAKFKASHEFSVNRAGQFASTYLEQVKESL